MSIKSHYTNIDESGRFLFYVYYVESNDIEKMLNYLEEDSKKIKKDIAFETAELIERIKKKGNLKKIIVGIFISLIASYIVWEIVK